MIGKRNGWVDRNERDLNEEDGVRSAALAEIAELARKDDVGTSRRAARASWRLMIERDLVFGKAAVAVVHFVDSGFFMHRPSARNRQKLGRLLGLSCNGATAPRVGPIVEDVHGTLPHLRS